MEAGSVIADRYEIERRAAAGGMAVVYRARDLLTGRAVAVKILRAGGSAREKRFAREARLLAELHHPTIVGYVDHGETPAGDLYLVMEWVEGEPLSARLAREGLTIGESLSLVRRVTEALVPAHARGLVHRDIKPSNLFLEDCRVERVRVLDFGVARAGVEPLTASGVRLGTLGYMAPEQARADPDVDARADIFSLGCVLYECITGRKPFAGDHEAAVLIKTLVEDPPDLCDVRPDAHANLGDLVRRMLAKDPAARPPSAEALLQEIERIASLDGPPPPTASTQTTTGAITSSERRLLSCVLCGEVQVEDGGSEATIEVMAHADPETEEAIRAVARAHGALHHRIGRGAFILALSGRGAATDLATRAARCALAVREVLPSAPIALAMGRGLLLDGIPSGHVVDRAVRTLRDSTAPGTRREGLVAMDATTSHLLEGRFDTRRGSGEVRWLVRERELTHEAGRLLLGRPAPFVGRRRELAFLTATFDECVEEPAARVVLVTGPPGSGKSRLVAELLAELADRDAPPEVWTARGDPVRSGSPFGLAVGALRTCFGLRQEEPIEVQRARLSSRVARLLPGERGLRVAEFLGEILGAAFPHRGRPELAAARADPVVRGDQMRNAFQEWIAAVCREKPLLVLLEDLHWGDLPTVELLDTALRTLASQPLLVLATARPEVHDQLPALWSERDLQELRVGPLGKKAARDLARSVLGAGVADERIDRLVDRSDGNPFFLEELIRAESAGEGGEGDALPDTVLAMVQARLDALEETPRRILRAASIFGQELWPGGLAALLGAEHDRADLDAWLDELVARELLTRRVASRFAGEGELAFRHDLVRVAAYSLLTEKDRRLGHRLVAEWLEGAGERDPAVVARHFLAGGEPARACGFYRRATEQALSGGDFAAAIEHAGRAIECGASGAEAGRIRLLAAEAHRWRGEIGEAATRAEEAMSALPAGDPSWLRAAGERAAALGQTGDAAALQTLAASLSELTPAPEAIDAFAVGAARIAMHLMQVGRTDVATELLARAEALARLGPIANGRIAQARAVVAQLAGDPSAYLELTARAAASFEEGGDLRNTVMQRMNLEYAYHELGAYAEAESTLTAALDACERMGLANIAAVGRHNLGLVLARLGRFDEAREVERQALEELERQGDRRLIAGARIYLALIDIAAGDAGSAVREAEAAVETGAAFPPMLVYALTALARACLLAGRVEEAVELAERAVDRMDAEGGIEEGEGLARLTLAEALEAAGHGDDARAAAVRARDRLLARAAKIADPRWRASFLEKVDENAKTVALAARLAG